MTCHFCAGIRVGLGRDDSAELEQYHRCFEDLAIEERSEMARSGPSEDDLVANQHAPQQFEAITAEDDSRSNRFQ